MSLADVGYDAQVELTAGKVVGNGKLGIGYVGDPVVGVDVVYAQQVETVHAQPYVFEKS